MSIPDPRDLAPKRVTRLAVAVLLRASDPDGASAIFDAVYADMEQDEDPEASLADLTDAAVGMYSAAVEAASGGTDAAIVRLRERLLETDDT
jgi:hypothetical protein